jgi:hypothetical protein
MKFWKYNATCVGELGNVYRIIVGKSEVRDHLGHLGVSGRIILKLI